MGVSAADYDPDSRLDIFKTNFEDDVPDLYHNEGAGNFTFRTFDAKLGFNLKYLGWGGGFFDYDNDGWPDIFIANGHVYPELENHHHPESPFRQRNLLYHNTGDGRIEIRWPSGAMDKIENASADRFLTVEEGLGIVQKK